MYKKGIIEQNREGKAMSRIGRCYSRTRERKMEECTNLQGGSVTEANAVEIYDEGRKRLTSWT